MAEQNNFGKTALVTGIVLGVAVGAFGAYTMSSGKVERPQTRLNAGESKKIGELSRVAADIAAAAKKNHTIVDVAPEGATINGKPRYTPIFFSPELWQVTLDDQKATTVIDIYDPSAQNVHKDVPNHWFISNGIADALGRSDGLTMDSDSDGFSNREEFDANTNPGVATSYPPLVEVGKPVKMEVVKIDRAKGTIAIDSTLAYDQNATSAGFKIFARPGDTKPLHKGTVKVGESFGFKAGEKRFEVLRFEQAEFSDSAGNKQTETVIFVRDTVTAGAEKEFAIRAGSPSVPGRGNDFGTSNAKGKTIEDVTATLRVTAGPNAGKPEGTLDVQLNGSFKVPGSELTCELTGVNDDGGVVIKPQNSESPVNVPKAAN
ncbi:MAG: hypothetical protein IKZ07_01090 [Akkermansia sp.]|nr:hypothetical protein [Akkermansia sp.]